MQNKLAVRSLFTLAILVCNQTFAQLARPPQYIAFAFDGSKSLAMWNETRAFAQEMNAQGKPLHFTYFLSGVVFLTEQNRSKYQGPHHRAGQADIDFGGSATDLAQRIDEVNSAIKEGHEMGSHANGHFHAESQAWSNNDWLSEFKLFNDLISDVHSNNSLSGNVANLILNPEKDVVGFRAPYLETTNGLWLTLKENNYRYDTSRVADMDYWPQKQNGVWNFPLAMLRIAETNKRTLSMDYNFYVADSNAQENPANSELYRRRMKETYENYFQKNYNGNRAPLHIGHHFSKWNGGAYFSALKDFASEVCGKPDVKCVTYRELANYMDSRGGSNLGQLRKNALGSSFAFDPLDVPAQPRTYSPEEVKSLGLSVDPASAHEE